MDVLLDAQRRSLGALQDACLERPAVHLHQLAALRRELALCTAAGSLHEYRLASGDAFELGRAACLDRIAGRIAIAASVGDDLAIRAEQIEYRSAVRATGHADLSQTLIDGAGESARWHARSAMAATAFARCVLNLLAANSRHPQLPDHWNAASCAWQSFHEADPAGARAAVESPRQIKRLGLRLPWCDDALLHVSGWLVRQPPPVTMAEPTWPADDEAVAAWLRDEQQAWQRSWSRPGSAAASGVGAGAGDDLGAERWLSTYRALAGSTTTASAVAEVARRALELCAGADNSIEVQRRLLAARLPAALAAAGSIAQLDSIAARQAVWSEPLLAGHAADLRASLADVRSTTEVELLTAHASSCLAVEADWNDLLMTSLLAPLRAAAMVGIHGDAERPGLLRAVGLAHQLLGHGPRTLLRSSSLTRFLSSRLLPALDEPDEGGGTWQGEAGRDLLAPLRGWRALAAADGECWAGDRHAFHATCFRLLDEAGAPEPETLPRQLHLWGQTAAVLDWDQLIANASRPAIPGWNCGLDSRQAL